MQDGFSSEILTHKHMLWILNTGITAVLQTISNVANLLLNQGGYLLQENNNKLSISSIPTLPTTTSPNAGDVFPVVNSAGNTTALSLSAAVGAVSLFQKQAGNYIYVTTTSTASANGTNLLNAYAKACALIPNGSALSSSNRVAVLIPPGTYTTTAGLQLSAQYVDIVGISSDANHVVIDVVNQTANDVQVSNITVATNGCSLASNLSLTVWTNCVVSCTGYKGSFGNSITISGTFNNCIANGTNGGSGFGGPNSVVSGTFNNCIGNGDYGATGGGQGGFGGQTCTLSGIFNNCTGNATGSSGFSAGCGGFAGSSSTVTGTFTNCIGSTGSNIGGASFAGSSCNVSGTFFNCIGNTYSAFNGYYGNATYAGAFIGGGSTISGTFINCRQNSTFSDGSAGINFFGSSATFTGKLINCNVANDIGVLSTATGKIRNYIDKNGDVYNYN